MQKKSSRASFLLPIAARIRASNWASRLYSRAPNAAAAIDCALQERWRFYECVRWYFAIGARTGSREILRKYAATQPKSDFMFARCTERGGGEEGFAAQPK